jgi:adenylylsulfate kinase-like enzyme
VEVLKERNDRKIYSKKKDIVGTDIKFPKPYKSDIIIKNNFLDTYEGNIKKIMKLINDKK